MAKMGRPPKGTPKGEPGPGAGFQGAPLPVEPPHWLPDLGRELWQRLVCAGICEHLTIYQSELLAAYCQSYARWREAEETLQAEGLTYAGETKGGYEYVTKRPEVEISHQAKTAMQKIALDLGIVERVDMKSGSKVSPLRAIEEAKAELGKPN